MAYQDPDGLQDEIDGLNYELLALGGYKATKRKNQIKKEIKKLQKKLDADAEFGWGNQLM